MQIEKNKVVSLNYTLKNDDGEILDTSEGRAPLEYIHGIGNLIPGLEEALEGKSKNDKLNVTIPPEKAYGVGSDQLIQTVKRSNFEENADIKVGMQFQAQMDYGMQLFTVTKIEGDDITLDGNHPLADQTLLFDVDVVNVRDATAEELEHGHVHQPGEHHH